MSDSLLAVVGTLAGATLSFAFQQVLARSTRNSAIQERIHVECLGACSELGGALVAYRHSQLARQTYRLREGSRSEALTEEVRRARGDAWTAYFRVELLTRDDSVLSAANDRMSQIRALKTVDDLTRLDLEAEAARVAIHHFVRAARDRLLGGDSTPKGRPGQQTAATSDAPARSA